MDPYTQGWQACAETIASLYEMMAKEVSCGRRLNDRILGPLIARTYQHAAEIARATTVTQNDDTATRAEDRNA